MSLYNTTNIKNLPQVDQIVDTDFLVVENFSGTNKLKFKDFVVGPTNTSFFNSIKTTLTELSSYDKTLTTNISALSTTAGALSADLAKTNLKINSNYEALTAADSSLDQKINTATIDFILSATDLNNKLFAVDTNYQSIQENYSKYFDFVYTFRWDPLALNPLSPPNYKETVEEIAINFKNEINNLDLLFVKCLDPSFNATLNYNIQTKFFFNNDTSTYLVYISSNANVPNSLTKGYIPPGGTIPVTTPTFGLRVFARFEPFNT